MNRTIGKDASTTKKVELWNQRLRNYANLLYFHYDKQLTMFLDYGLNNQNVWLQKDYYVDHNGYLQETRIRKEEGRAKLGYVPHYGYNSLFPLIMELLPLNSSELI